MVNKLIALLAALTLAFGLYVHNAPVAEAGSDAMCYTAVTNGFYQMYCWGGGYTSKWYSIDSRPWNKALWDTQGHKIATIINYWFDPSSPKYNGYGYRDVQDNYHQISCVLYTDCTWVTH